MSDVRSTGTDRDTKWGSACAAIFAGMMRRAPELKCNIGLDESASLSAPPLISFTHGGENPTWPYRGAGGGGPRHVYDRAIDLDVDCWGRDAAEAEAIYEALLLATNVAAHGRAAKLGAFKPQAGTKTSGNLGAKMIGKLTVRITVNEPPVRTAVPTSHGETVEVDAPGENPGQGQSKVLA